MYIFFYPIVWKIVFIAEGLQFAAIKNLKKKQ